MQKIERDWQTRSNLRAICLWFADAGHRCGYVEVPLGHPLFGVNYREHADCLLPLWKEALASPIGKRGIIAVVISSPERAAPEGVFNVHGSLTFSAPGEKGYPVTSTGWWFGFDCAHSGDASAYSAGVQRTEEYVVAECERLAEHLAGVGVAAIADEVR